MKIALFCLLALCLPQRCIAARVELDWDIDYLNISRDGYSTWRAIGVNGILPISPVHVTQGDTLILNVHNALDVVTSVHAHGLYQKYTDYYDGAATITDCGIPPGENFTYVIETTDQVGTFWLHGHFHEQFADGLRTPFIIHEKTRPNTYDEEVLVFLEDWGHSDFATKMSDYSTVKFADLSPFYPTVLINGINGNLTAPIELQPRKRYRFRVISMSSSYWFKFRLPEHKMQIIEADGVYSEPSEVDGLTLGPGQRFSAIVTAHDTVAFNYIYNVTLFADFVPPALGLLPRYYSGSLRYNSDAPVKQLPAVSDEELIWNNIVKMQALDKQLLLPVDRQIVLTVRSYIPEFGIPYYSFSDFAFNQTLVPTLFTALSMGDLAFNSSVYSPLAQAHVVQNGEAVELLVNNPTTKDHALHLHMQNFQVVETGPFGDAVANGKPIVPHQTAGPWPMRCDTVTISPFSFLKLRFRVTRGAVMNFHCHNSNHNFHGLAAVVIAAPDLLQKHVKVPKSVLRMCELQSIKTSGNAAGNQGFNMTGLPAPLLVDRS